MGLVIEALPDLGVTRVSRWIFNCYVIHRGDGGPVVVDAGLPTAADDVSSVLRNLGGSLKAVVATHGHSDHVAGAEVLAHRYGAPIYLPEPTLGYIDGARPRSPGIAKVAAIWPTIVDQPFDRLGCAGLIRGARIAGYGSGGGMLWRGSRPAGGLASGQSVPGAPAWTVLAAPGHTDDSVVLWHEARRALISGDAVLSAGGRAWMTPEIVDASTARVTAANLQQLPVAHLLPGHGRPVHAHTETVWATRRN